MKAKSFLFLTTTALALLTGCKTVKTIQIVADGGMASASVQVDVVADTPAVQTVPVSQYFLPGNPVRAGANPKTVRFGSGTASQSVSVSGRDKVVVLAHLPGAYNDTPGDNDPRRKTIPLSGKYNGQKVTPTMQVTISPGSISVKPITK